jgi:IclR family KDG regulon transcriptional repressor
MKPVGVVAKVLKIFDLLHEFPGGLSLTQISAKADLNTTTCYRILSQLVSEGHCNRDDKRHYRLGSRILQIAATYDDLSTLRRVAGPHLCRLVQRTGETANLTVVRGGVVHYVEIVESPHEFRIVGRVGLRRPIHCTAVGKAVLAFLSEKEQNKLLKSIRFQRLTSHTIHNSRTLTQHLELVRRRGFAVDDEETLLGVRCVGAPVFNWRREVVAAISIAAPTTRLSPKAIAEVAEVVKEAALAISVHMGFEGGLPLERDRTEARIASERLREIKSAVGASRTK